MRATAMMACALLLLVAWAQAGTEMALDQGKWLRYLDEPLPASTSIAVERGEAEVGAAYLELEAYATSDMLVTIWGDRMGVPQVLDRQAIGTTARRVRLDVSGFMQAAKQRSVSMELTVAPLQPGAEGGVYLRPLEAGKAARLVTVAMPKPMLGVDDPGVALQAKTFGEKSSAKRDVEPSIAVSPNPFNPKTSISLVLPASAAVSVEIYDVRGQKVKTLLRTSQLSAGQHDFVWEGDWDGGRKAASGVYLYKVKAGSSVYTGKIALLK